MPSEPVVLSWGLDQPPDRVAELAACLSDDERRRADTFTRDESRRRFLVARGRLRRALGERLGVPAGEVGFRYGPSGKPELATGDGLCFNLAHSADLAVCAIADHPVGIDLERVRPMKNTLGLAERWFHPEEQARIRGAGDPLAEFFRTWVMKEAALKLIGVGVGESLPKVLTPPVGEMTATGLPENGLGLTECRVAEQVVDSEFVAAVARPMVG